MKFINYNWTLTKVTSIIRDDNYIWAAFLGSLGNTILYKAAAFNPKWKYYEVTPTVDEITRMKIVSNYLYCAVNDSVYLGLVYSTSNPLSLYCTIDRPVGINEETIDITYDASYVYFLTAGEASGENAKVVKYSKATGSPLVCTYVETIDLNSPIINNASGITIDSDGNIWVVTNETQSKLIKIIEGS